MLEWGQDVGGIVSWLTRLGVFIRWLKTAGRGGWEMCTDARSFLCTLLTEVIYAGQVTYARVPGFQDLNRLNMQP